MAKTKSEKEARNATLAAYDWLARHVGKLARRAKRAEQTDAKAKAREQAIADGKQPPKRQLFHKVVKTPKGGTAKRGSKLARRKSKPLTPGQIAERRRAFLDGKR